MRVTIREFGSENGSDDGGIRARYGRQSRVVERNSVFAYCAAPRTQMFQFSSIEPRLRRNTASPIAPYGMLQAVPVRRDGARIEAGMQRGDNVGHDGWIWLLTV